MIILLRIAHMSAAVVDEIRSAGRCGCKYGRVEVEGDEGEVTKKGSVAGEGSVIYLRL